MSTADLADDRSDAGEHADDRDRLIEATLAILGAEGLAAFDEVRVAREAGLDEGAIAGHFTSLHELLLASAAVGGRQHADEWAQRLAEVDSLSALVDVAEELHQQATTGNNTATLAQFLAAAQTDPLLAAVTGQALDQWVHLLEPVLARLLADSPLGEVLDPAAMAALLADAFVGIDLAAVTHDRGALRSRFVVLRELAALVEVMGDLGPRATRVVGRALARAVKEP